MPLAIDDKRIKLEPPEWSVNRTQVVRVRKIIMMIYGNTIKDIIKMYPKWVWAGNIFCVALGLWVIFWL